METPEPVRSVLLCLTGMEIDGGIACVSRSVVAVLEEEVRARRLERVDRVLLLDRGPTAIPPGRGVERLARGSRTRFIASIWRLFHGQRHDLVFFDLYGLARLMELPLPGFPARRTAIFTHAFDVPDDPRGLRARALYRASHLIANSNFGAEALRRRLPHLTVPVHVVYPCIDTVRERLWSAGGPPDPRMPRPPVVVCAARMSLGPDGRKGHDTLLEAWPDVLTAVPTARLLLAGRGNDEQRLRAKALALGLGSSVQFLGQIEASELAEIYRGSAVYAMPSRTEGFGISFAEAMWHGLPCIGTTADAAGEVIAHGETGLVVPYADVPALTQALQELLTHPDLGARMGAAGFRRVRERYGYTRFRDDLRAALGLSTATGEQIPMAPPPS